MEHGSLRDIERRICEAGSKVTKKREGAKPALTGNIKWPVNCTVGPGLEGAIACETKVGYVDGTHGTLLYQGYDIFDLCAHSTYEEVSYLLLNGKLPNKVQLSQFKKKLVEYRPLPNTMRRLMSFPVEEMNPMSALRLGTNFMRQRLTWKDDAYVRPAEDGPIAADEDSIGMETMPYGEEHAVYEFKTKKKKRPEGISSRRDDGESMDSCIHLISGLATITAGINRLRIKDALPLDPDPVLSHAGNLIYMMTGRKPTAEEERIMDIVLILHADHGMNASTFASMVVASTMSDYYLSIGSGIAALNGPLHGGANEEVIKMLEKIGGPDNVEAWLDRQLRKKLKIPGFGHRVYRTYDPRALVLAPLAKMLAQSHSDVRNLYNTARQLEKTFIARVGKEKKIFPNVDFYSGIVYKSLGIPTDIYTTIFAVSRVAGWTARVLEYHRRNRIFRPRAVYTGSLDRRYVPMEERS